MRGLLGRFGTARLQLPHDVRVRNQFDVRIVGFFQALLDLRAEPSVMLGALHVISHEFALQLRAGRFLAWAASVNAFFNS